MRSCIKLSMMRHAKRMTKLEGLRQQIYGCRICPDLKNEPLSDGFGDPLAKVIIVGQSLHGLCKDTPRQIPFIGPMEYDSGDVLFDGILLAGHTPFDYFITNIVKHHATGNRPNKAKEELCCFNFLVREVEIIRPKVIITLGRQAADGIRRHTKHKAARPFGDILATIVTFKYLNTKTKKEEIAQPWPSGVTGKRSVYMFSVSHPSYAMRQGPDAVSTWQRSFADLLKRIEKILKGKKNR